MKRIAGLVLVLALSFGLFKASTAFAAAVVDSDHLIVPGVGIGPVKVGMQVTDVVSILGTPKVTKGTPSGKTVRYYWFDSYWIGDTRYMPNGGGIYIVCDDKGKVLAVVAWLNSQYVTDKGLHTGMTEEQVRSVMGEPTKIDRDGNDDHDLRYSSNGKAIMFRINDNPKWGGYKKVVLISVFESQE